MVIFVSIQKTHHMKKYYSIKTLLDITEIAGLIVLALVVTAIMGTTLSWKTYSMYVQIGFILFFVSIIVSFFSSFFRLTKVWSSYRFLTVWGIILLVVGAYGLVLIPEFFHSMKDIPYSYWHRVSFYSMPAICIEGGLFNLFRVYSVYARDKRTRNEHYALFVGFLMYAVTAISVNFLAIGNSISVDTQLLFSRIILCGACIVLAVVYYYRNTALPKLL